MGVPDATLRDLYRGALATVQMGVSEPLGLASMEAQACGSPVVVAGEGGLPRRSSKVRPGGPSLVTAAVADVLTPSHRPVRNSTVSGG